MILNSCYPHLYKVKEGVGHTENWLKRGGTRVLLERHGVCKKGGGISRNDESSNAKHYFTVILITVLMGEWHF